ncbi:hypothetical protein BD410DRAFT_845023 [Rickenella mellea]|uniref:BTB domain-containing protein n=1 Tax=Rickenella mellea TaxID=50990 RepID=A0A4Y7PJI6_9AGAM|nr:hypothetical protein BD410DRAFT_845023 [Rickenella mellea]
MAVHWTKAENFFIPDGDICFLVEDRLFKIHRSKIDLQKSDYFNKLLGEPNKDADGSEDKPFRIQGHGKTLESFSHLCSVVYTLKFDSKSPQRKVPAFYPKQTKLLLTLAKSIWIYECFVSHSLIQNTLPDRAPPRKELFTETPLEVLMDWVVVMDQENPKSTPQEKEEHTKYRNIAMNTFYCRMIKEDLERRNEPDSKNVKEIMNFGREHEFLAALLYIYLAYHSADNIGQLLSGKENPVGASIRPDWAIFEIRAIACRKWLIEQWPHGVARATTLKDMDYCLPNHIVCRNKLKQELEALHKSQLTEPKKNWDIMGYFYKMSGCALKLGCVDCFQKFEEAMDPLRTEVRRSLKCILVELEHPTWDIWP